MQKHFIVFMEVPSSGFSGGRYHILMLCQGLLQLGHKITIVSERKAGPFFNPFESLERSANWLSPRSLKWKAIQFDFGIIVPSKNSNVTLAKIGYFFCKLTNAPSIFVDFESPNWWLETQSNNPALHKWDHWDLAYAKADAILSTTKLGKTYAQQFYDNKIHLQAYAPINGNALVAAENAYQGKTEKRISVFSRFGPFHSHKRAEDIGLLAHPKLRDYEIAFVGSTGDGLEYNTLISLKAMFKRYNITFNEFSDLTEEEKFELLLSSQFAFFPTSFEGFGYPPVEAAAAGVRTLATDIPVLREHSGFSIFYDMTSHKSFEEGLSEILKANKISKKNKNEIRLKFSAENVAAKLLQDLQPLSRNTARNSRLLGFLYIFILTTFLKNRFISKVYRMWKRLIKV